MHLVDILILKERPISQKLYVIGLILLMQKVKIMVHGWETIEEQQSTGPPWKKICPSFLHSVCG